MRMYTDFHQHSYYLDDIMALQRANGSFGAFGDENCLILGQEPEGCQML